MKTPLLYGVTMAIASAVLTLALFFAGYHSDPTKMKTAQAVAMVIGLGVNITGICLGIRAQRAELPPEKPFSYGQAVVSGLLVGLCAAFFISLFQVIYMSLINPGFVDTLIQQQSSALEAKGMNSDQIEKATGVMRFMFHPALQFGLGVLGGAFWGLVISLIAAAFLKRTGSEEMPPLPPPVA